MFLTIALLVIKEHANHYRQTACLIDEPAGPPILRHASTYNPKSHKNGKNIRINPTRGIGTGFTRPEFRHI
jgi:hypothetical protein